MAKARAIPDLHGTDAFRQAAGKAVAVRADELWEHADNVLDVGDIERVHDMRVATRRLRAVLEIFAPCFPKRAHRAALKEVKALADALGERRDPDVQIEHLEVYADAAPDQDRPGVDVLVSRLRSRQAAANADLAAALAEMERSDLRGRLLALVEEARGMKARRVKGLDPDMALADAAERIVRVRLAELYSFVPRALNPGEVTALHDLRIAAKRLRYVLEVTGPFLGEYAPTATKRARDLQDLVGEIHDCDVQRPQVLALLDELRAHDAADLRRAAGAADDLDPALSAQTRHRAAYRGLEVLAAHLEARRELLFERFLALWEKLESQGFRRKLEKAIEQRSSPEPVPSQDGNGRSEHADALRSAVANLVR